MMEKLLLSLCAAAGILVAGCSDPSDGESDIRIAPSITRVDGVNFTEGDRIGVTVSLSSGDYAANRLMTYDGLFFSAAGLVWYDEAQGASTFTAYYPYRDEGVPGTFAVAADQRDGCTPSDLLGAVTRDVLPGSTPVKMQFHHLLSQLNIVVQNRSDRAVRQVAIDGFVPEAAVDLAVPEATVRAGEAVEVLAFAVTPNALYRAVLVPQRATLQVDVTLEDGTVASKSVPDAALEGGKRYDLSVVVEAVPEPELEVTLSGEIVDWIDGGELGIGGDGGDEPDEGDGKTVVYAGETYSTVTIDGRVWMAENLRYRPSDATFGDGVWNPEVGASAVAELGLLYDYATVTGGAVPTSEGLLRGICPPGWHIPDTDELEALAASGERPADFFTVAGFWNSSGFGSYGDASKGYLWGTGSSEAGRRDCIACTTDGLPLVKSLPEAHGLSLRCVKD
ncbi:fibrobacter succinogenes major domain (Fib_succ_major) [Alistipes sp. CAG:268]|jgi:hypothetical protein|uniref:fimbrillin family protein n=1 Tax=Alistipes sp. CAG:268 TaxID=1262693 RepID=UPI0003387655|nr:fimbrillin family protein [Alistipes sp. CAG:268]CDC97149.1 fibrobacter succinogenes major domain (Fib_succ_major) [Alistipes sp. CAG:268]